MIRELVGNWEVGYSAPAWGGSKLRRPVSIERVAGEDPRKTFGMDFFGLCIPSEAKAHVIIGGFDVRAEARTLH
jgi:hypothetical protein